MMRSHIERQVRRGINAGELRADLDADAEASLLVSAIEGALLLLHQLYDDVGHVDRVTAQLDHRIRTLAREER